MNEIRSQTSPEEKTDSQKIIENPDPYPGTKPRSLTEWGENSEWDNWHWQLKNSIKTFKDLNLILSQKGITLPYGISEAENAFPFSVTPYYLSLIKNYDYSDPIFSMSIPNILELSNPSFLNNDPLHEEEDTVVDGLVHRYEDRALLVSTSRCAMYCRHSLAAGTKVTMSDFSFKNIEEVNINDKVITHTGKVSRVYDVFNRDYKRDVLILATSKSQKIETTQEHPFFVIKKSEILCNSGNRVVCKPDSNSCKKRHPNRITEFNPKFIEASKIEVGDYLAIPSSAKTNEKKHTDEDLAYLLGLYAAEGDLPTRKNGKIICVRLSLNPNEEHTLAKKAKQIVEKLNLGKVVIKTYLDKSNCTVRIFGESFPEFVKKHCGRYSDKKKLSEEIINESSDGFKKSLLRGMLDGDGYYSNKHKKHTNMNSIEFNTVSDQMANQIFMLLVSIGYKPSIYHQKENRKKVIIGNRQLKNFKTMHRIRTLDTKDFSKWFNIESNKTSRCEAFIHNGYVFCRVTSINKRRPLKKERFYDLSVEGDESYLANFAAVHNCTRKRVAGSKEYHLSDLQLDNIVTYLKQHPKIKDVIVSGGDPFTMSTKRLEKILRCVRSVPSVEIIRIGTRTPVTMPQRITGELISMINRYHPVFVNTHFNHPNEITEASSKACLKMIERGIPVNNQSVLLKGINDDPIIMAELCRSLLRIRLRPYYLFQCDLVKGVEHFRTPISKGIEIMDYLRGRVSGLGIPQFIVDAPEGKGKIPILPNYIVKMNKNETVLRNYNGEKAVYPEPI